MNWGHWFSSPGKIILTIVNMIILGIACAIVCLVSPRDSGFPADKTSADWDSTSRAWLSTRALPRLAGPVPTMPPKLGYHGEHMLCFQRWKWLFYRFVLVSID
jgi:hypothetical protein